MLSSLSEINKPSDTKKIKINIKLKGQATEPILPMVPVVPVSQQLSPEIMHKPDIFDLMQECRKKHIMVCGTGVTLYNILAKKAYQHKNNTAYIGHVFASYFLYILGDGALVSSASNTHDFYTDQPVARIPKVYIYCIKDNDHIYAFDIRSLNGYYQEISATQTTLPNPYTMQSIDKQQITHMERKITWLQRLGFHTIHLASNKTLPLHKLTERYAVDVFHKISMYQYVSYTWFMDLTTHDLQKLYYELWDLWTYRLSLTGAEARKITKDGALFTNWNNVKKYTNQMKDTLRHEILKNTEKLVTEGQTEEDRKTGSLYFMLGFVQVSQDAADHHPSLFNAVYSGEI